MALISNERYSLFYQRIGLIYQRPEVKASLEVILSVFMVAILIFAAIRPTLANVAVLQKKVEDLDAANKKADKKITQIYAAQVALDNYQDKLRLFDEAVPNTLSYYDMTGRVELMAKRNGLTVQAVALPGTKLFGEGRGFGDWSLKLVDRSKVGVVQAGVSFVANGSPVNVRRFLGQLEGLDRLAKLDSITMTTDPLSIKGQVTIKVTGQIYFYFYSET